MSKTVLYEGPDLSYHNGVVNIKRIRDAGCGRILLRFGYGKNNVDEKYIVNAQACYNLNVPSGGYWFSYAYNKLMSNNEADFACDQADKFWKRCVVAHDFEYDSVRYARTKGVEITKEMSTDMAIAFLKRVKERGHIPAVYTNRDYIRNYYDMERITKEVGPVYVWYARYINNLPASEQIIPDIWQYTSKARIDGVNGNVDMNKFYTNFDDEVIRVEEDKVEVSCNINILNFQKATNADGYRDQNGNQLVEDGIDGPKTQYVRKQINLKAKRVGLFWRVGSKGNVVKWWQQRCNEILGQSQLVDGLYGKNARKATLEVQDKLALAKDGIAGYNSIQAAFYN